MFLAIRVNNFLPTCESVRQLVDVDRTHTVLVSPADYQAITQGFRAQITQRE